MNEDWSSEGIGGEDLPVLIGTYVCMGGKVLALVEC